MSMTLDDLVRLKYGKQTAEYLPLRDLIKRSLKYDPETGVMTRLENSPSSWKNTGTECRTKNAHGYFTVRIANKTMLVHRLAFVLMTGNWPAGFVDHINHNRSDNRWKNLRTCTKNQNCRNLSGPRLSNSSGVIGVHWDIRFKKWKASITADGRRYNLGSFDQKEDAVRARIEAAKRLHGEFSGNHFRGAS